METLQREAESSLTIQDELEAAFMSECTGGIFYLRMWIQLIFYFVDAIQYL